MHNGIYCPDPGTIKDAECDVCGTNMVVQRNVYDYTSWTGVMAKIKRKHDRFVCPHRKTDWHQQVVAIKHFADQCPSAQLAAIALGEIAGIIDRKEPSKHIGY